MGRKRVPSNETSLVYSGPRTEAQQNAVQIYSENDLVFFLGPPGSGKTHMAVHCALMDLQGNKLIKRRRCDKIVITRPIVEAGEYLGALPGEVDEKVHPYMMPVYDCVSKMVDHSSEFIDNHFQISPLAYMRGVTLEHCTAILDEAQNCTARQLKLFLTRLGVGGKMIISGDIDQTDIGKQSGLKIWADALRGTPGIGFIEFTEVDIVRHPLVKAILNKAPRC